MDEIIHHLAVFVFRIWQIHIFSEGNTRTTAVFFIKYLRTLGFETTNDIFAENAWYFRNVLVRANYNDLKNGVHETTEYLELFLRNLLLDEKNELHNRTMHISGLLNGNSKVDIEQPKVDIGQTKVDINQPKVDIKEKLVQYNTKLKGKTMDHIVTIYDTYRENQIFGRTQVVEVTGLKPARASQLLKFLVDNNIIEVVQGHGKGKYRFK